MILKVDVRTNFSKTERRLDPKVKAAVEDITTNHLTDQSKTLRIKFTTEKRIEKFHVEPKEAFIFIDKSDDYLKIKVKKPSLLNFFKTWQTNFLYKQSLEDIFAIACILDKTLGLTHKVK